jgi:hypothetical protein
MENAMENEMVLSERDLQAIEERERAPGEIVISVRMFLKAEGQGTFRIGNYDTAQGDVSAWLQAGKLVQMVANPAQGWNFAYWDVNGNYISDKPTHSIYPQKGATITAHFEKS